MIFLNIRVHLQNAHVIFAGPHHFGVDPDPAFHIDVSTSGPTFHIDVDPDPNFHIDVDPDPTFHFDMDQDPNVHIVLDPDL